MFEEFIAFTLSHFTVVCLILTLLFSLGSLYQQPKPIPNIKIIDTFLGYTLFFAVGLCGLQGFILHTFFADYTAQFIGWQPSPFQFEVGMANLAFAVMGSLCWKNRFGFRAATALGASCFLLGDAVGHMHQMLKAHDYTPGNSGSVFYTDIIIPTILLGLLLLHLITTEAKESLSKFKVRKK